MRAIPGILGYLATEGGNIFSTKTNGGIIRKAFPNKRDGRLRVCLSINDKRSMHSVHVLVYKAYNNVESIPGGYCVHHANEIYTDNTPGNLVLKKKGEHSSEHIRKRLAEGERMNRKLSDQDVHAICLMLAEKAPSKNIYSMFPGMSTTTLSYIRTGKQWIHISSKYFGVDVKQGELLGSPEAGNQHPSLTGNGLEGSTHRRTP